MSKRNSFFYYLKEYGKKANQSKKEMQTPLHLFVNFFAKW
jgi:hypothetical protein